MAGVLHRRVECLADLRSREIDGPGVSLGTQLAALDGEHLLPEPVDDEQ